MTQESHLAGARSLPRYRSKIATGAAALAAAVAGCAGILKTAGSQLNFWPVTALSAVVAGLLVTLFSAWNEVRRGRRTREVVVALSTVNTDRSVLDHWADRDHLRGVLYVDVIVDDEAEIIVAALPVRLGELLATSMNPVVVLRTLTEKKLPPSPKGLQLRFVPEKTDQFIWLKQLYDKDSLEDWLFDAQELRQNLGRSEFAPDVVILSGARGDMEERALALSPDPHGCLRVQNERDFSIDARGELPSVFNIVAELRVSVSGSGNFAETFDRSHMRERFGIYARLRKSSRAVSIVDFASVYRVGEQRPQRSMDDLAALLSPGQPEGASDRPSS